ncbi:hypothetical protein D9757_015464 [Collybiopsis confluens]|uniref:Uncharacterized protein n=1 Tax=Collybiopsis confluens TaxID=2823264 RepID=A0A8H5C2J6_9AGAR|nr:hypothetical protein D9757_015464 [Collybiopsis confluens]
MCEEGTPQSINLRIEGSRDTFFEGFILTKGHVITTASSQGCHCCNGRNGNGNPCPGPTPTTALDDASMQSRTWSPPAPFTFDATYNQGFNDFFITRIGTDANARPNYWTLYIDYQFQQRGGCQLIAKPGQRVLWVFGASENTPFLDLHGPTTVRRNQSTTFGVINGRNGEPIEGATVRGQQTTANGQVQLTFDTAGRKNPLSAASMSISEPQSINLRIEGSQTTIFEDFILTKGHVITTASSEGCHCCNGRNGDRNTSPGPTPTTALDDASIQKAFTFDATYDKKYDDFLIKRIGPDTNTVTNYWLLYIDYQFAKFGGCQLKVNPSQKVLWASNQSTTFGVITAGTEAYRVRLKFLFKATKNGTIRRLR